MIGRLIQLQWLDAEDLEGRSAVELAISYGLIDMLELLTQFGMLHTDPRG